MKENDSVNIIHSAAANAAYNYYDGMSNQCARAYYIFVKNKVNVVKIASKFEKKYGISLESYIYLSTLTASYLENYIRNIGKRERYFYNDWNIGKNLLGFKEEKKKDVLAFLDNISFTMEDESLTHIETSKYELFLAKRPLLKIGNNHYLPIESSLYNNLIFNSLFHKINTCYEGKSTFINQFGLMFQDYVEYISNKFCERSNGRYEFIKEFSYGKPEKNSPDIMILHKTNNKTYVLVIEVKSARLLYDMIEYKDISKETNEKSVNKVISKPILQSIHAMNDVVLKGVRENLNSSVDYIFATVTMNNFPYKFQYLEALHNRVKPYKESLSILTYNAICIEEFELLLQVLEYNTHISFVDFFNDDNIKNGDSIKNLLRKFPTQKDKRSYEIFLESQNRCKFHGYFDPISELKDECTNNAFERYLYSDKMVSSIDDLFM